MKKLLGIVAIALTAVMALGFMAAGAETDVNPPMAENSVMPAASAQEAAASSETEKQTPVCDAPTAITEVTPVPTAAAMETPDAEPAMHPLETLLPEETIEANETDEQPQQAADPEETIQPEEQTEVENSAPEIDLSSLKVEIFSSLTDCVAAGTEIYLTSNLTGFDEIPYTLQWEYNDGSGWMPVEGATQDHYEFYADAQNVCYAWRLTVTF